MDIKQTTIFVFYGLKNENKAEQYLRYKHHKHSSEAKSSVGLYILTKQWLFKVNYPFVIQSASITSKI